MAGNHNHFVAKFLTIYSQTELSTAGTLGYDPQTYVDTKLDLKLTPRIYSPGTRLVVLTGNARTHTCPSRRLDTWGDVKNEK